MMQRRRPVGRPIDQDLRQRILTTTMSLLMRHKNLRSITVDEIADVARTSKATIYKHWPSKSALFVESFFDDVNEELVFDSSLPRLDALKQQLHRLVALLSSAEGDVLRTLIAESHFDPKIRVALLEGFFLPRRRASAQFIADAIEDGTFRRGISPEIAVDALYGAIFYALMVGYRELDTDWVDEVAGAVLNGLMPRGLRG